MSTSTERSSESHVHSGGPGFATPLEAMRDGFREKLMYVTLVSFDGKSPDAFATIDIDPKSDEFCQVIHKLEMPHFNDELHHFGWNVCASCCYDKTKQRRFIIAPGNLSSRIYIIDVIDPRAPKIHKVISPEQVKKNGLSAPHTVHCLPDGTVMISMLGDEKLESSGGFLMLDSNFEILGRWNPEDESKANTIHEFWYQSAHNVMVSSEFTAPKNYYFGLKVGELPIVMPSFGQRLNFWNWRERTLLRHIDLGSDSKLLFGARFLHDPLSTHGFAVSALGGTIWHWFKDDLGAWQAEQVVQLESVKVSHIPDVPATAFPSDLIISLDDRFMYVSNWFLGDVRQYDITTPSRIRLVGRVQCGKAHAHTQVDASRAEIAGLRGGPHMMQLSLDGKRLYVTNSLLSSWDDQFYPELGPNGFWMMCIDCNTEQGGMKINEDFLVQFGDVEGHAYRAHEMRYPGGDCTSDIWLAANPDVNPVL